MPCVAPSRPYSIAQNTLHISLEHIHACLLAVIHAGLKGQLTDSIQLVLDYCSLPLDLSEIIFTASVSSVAQALKYQQPWLRNHASAAVTFAADSDLTLKPGESPLTLNCFLRYTMSRLAS